MEEKPKDTPPKHLSLCQRSTQRRPGKRNTMDQSMPSRFFLMRLWRSRWDRGTCHSAEIAPELNHLWAALALL